MEIIPTPKDIELVPTSAFSHGSYKFEKFNYLQSLAYPYHSHDCNLIVSAATSAGKTILAELSIASTIASGKKAIFLSPLKAVTAEKYDDWTSKDHFFSNKNVEMITGDHRLTDSRIKKVKAADLILMTSEMLDTRTRYAGSPSSSWLGDVGIVVVDEAHLLTTSRGSALEVGLMKFAELNPQAKIIFLSATMSNHKDIGRWVEYINKKETKVLASEWRPVDLYNHEIMTRHEKGTALELIEILTCSTENLAPHLVAPDQQKRMTAENRVAGGVDNIKTLVFVHTKSLGRDLAATCTSRGLRAEFHNADLSKTQRNKLENKFKKDLDILISTSTLAWGVNLPSRNCIIVGGKRGMETVESLEISQMCGRAGRFGMYERGDAYLINCRVDDKFEVKSQLGKKLPFYIVAEIANGTFNTQGGCAQWLKRSLLCQGMSAPNTWIGKKGDSYESLKPERMVSGSLTAKCFTNLLKWDCIKNTIDDKYEITPLGKIARDLYIDPQDVKTWNDNFQVVEKSDLWENPAAVSWAIAHNMNTCSLSYVPQSLQPLVREFKQSFGTQMRTTNQAIVATIFYRLIREGYDSYMLRTMDGLVSPYLQSFLRDSGRIFSALQRINSLNRWDREQDLEILKARIVHGVGKELVDLVQIPGVGGAIAMQLYKAGFRTLEDVIEKKDSLSDYIERKANVTRILNGLRELQ